MSTTNTISAQIIGQPVCHSNRQAAPPATYQGTQTATRQPTSDQILYYDYRRDGSTVVRDRTGLIIFDSNRDDPGQCFS